jgi:hypothetical protein
MADVPAIPRYAESDPLSGITSLLPDGMQGIMQQAGQAYKKLGEQQQAEDIQYAQKKYDVDLKKAQLAADYAKRGAGSQAAVYKKYEGELMAPPPTIQYSPETAQGMQSLAVLLPIAGALMGGKGQLSGIGAMNAMSGILEGHRQGNQDRIALETKNFEQQMQNWKIHQEQIKGAFERALQMAKINASAAQQQLQVDMLKLGAPMIAEEAKHNTVNGTLQKMGTIIDKATSMIEQAQIRMYTSAANASLRYGSTMTDDAKRLAAERLLAGDKSAITNIPRGDKTAIENLLPEVAKSKGFTAADIAAAQIALSGAGAFVRTAETQKARTGAAEDTALGAIDIIKKESAKVPRGTFKTMNAIVQRGLEEISDPALLGFKKALDTLIIEYARATTTVGQSTDTRLKLAQGKLSTVTSEEALYEQLDVMQQEMENARKAQDSIIRERLKQIGKSTDSSVPPDVTTSGWQ